MTEKTIIHTYEEIDGVMSNCDHTIDQKVAKKLQTGKFYAQYSGWNFCAYVYWKDTLWICEVWTYHSHVETLHAETLEEIMETVSQDYGYE